jgi:6-pyruvoyltetrahydropterin/6-carboxytetrahydropterin synthase
MPEGHLCRGCHGHSYRAEIVLTAKNLDDQGMVVDVGIFDGLVRLLDHKHLNDIISGNPTVEVVAKFLAQKVLDVLFRLGCSSEVFLERVRVYETEDVWGEYEIRQD